MRYEYIEPFVSSTIRVLDSVIQADVSKGNVSLVNVREISGDVTIIIPLRGDTEGNLILNMDTDTALNICGVLNGETFDSMTSVGLDTIAELANMIAGNSTSVLHDMGYSLDVMPPVVLIRQDLIARAPAIEAFQIPLFTEWGEITLNVSLRTN